MTCFPQDQGMIKQHSKVNKMFNKHVYDVKRIFEVMRFMCVYFMYVWRTLFILVGCAHDGRGQLVCRGREGPEGC